MTMKVTELSKDDDPALTTFLDSLAQSSASVLGYHYPFYRDMLVSLGLGDPLYLGVYDGAQLVGILPSMVRRSAHGLAINSLPFFGPNAGALSSAEGKREVHQLLVDELLRRAEAEKALSCSVYTPFLGDAEDVYASAFQGGARVDKLTQYLRLDRIQWSAEVRRDLRHAEQLGVTVTTNITQTRLDAFYAIYETNCQDHGIPLKPRRCIDELTRPAVLGKRTHMYLALVEGRVIGGLLMIWSPATASYYIPCSDRAFRTSQPGSLLIDHAARHAQQAGLRIWNWESSPDRESGVYRFKKKWGSEECTYRVYCRSFAGTDKLAELGRERIASEFPYFFVWPFDRLATSG